MKTKPHRIFAKKQLGQNFLTDPNIKRKIIEACHLTSDDIVLEIGPGMGVLTNEIAPKVKKLIAVETDRRLHEELLKKMSYDNVEIIRADFLEFSMTALPDSLKVIGNLPYYISTPIIEKIFSNKTKIKLFYATLQYELGQRLVAKPNSKEYGSFTCFTQYHADVKMLFKIKNTAFRPIPKVHSCFLEFKLKENPLFTKTNEKLLFDIIRTAFQQRRKMIVNALSRRIGRDKIQTTLEELRLSPKLRAENLTLQDFVNLTNALDLPNP